MDAAELPLLVLEDYYFRLRYPDDVDLLFVSPAFASMPKLHRRSTFLIETGLARDKELFVEPICVTLDEFEDAVQWATIQREALRTGIVLLDRLGLTDRVFAKEAA